MNGDDCRTVHATLEAAYGPQGWWPAQTPFEVMVGAVLTQNTAWTNVERALERLTGRIALTAEAILALDEAALADALRPSGYFNVKARRLRSFCQGFLAGGGLAGLAALDTQGLRRHLLDIPGIGPETADDILLYAFERPVFVVDAYTRRVFSRLGLLGGDEGYEAIRDAFETALGADVPLFNAYHALIVRHGKDVCRKRPRCQTCCLRSGCPTGHEIGSSLPGQTRRPP
ncbi:endonuclease [uncultured Thiodictyon sp.]|uniref:endonuclease III domain-containing protein n=1 Tax=uncultured Thiodictyon sp. TaxID=1846217 RepID=UPI0025CB9ACC|nr:endonuclease [uncultured Thiodictyon sp.]